MATNIDLLSDGLKNYIVRPLNAFGLGGFVFDVEGESTVNLSTEITDHYVEDNSAIQDHIAVRPKKITLKGYVGELVFQGDDSADYTINKLTQKLTVASALLPQLTGAVEQFKQIREEGITEINLESINKIADFWAFAKNISPPVNSQERAYLYFESLMNAKILLSVQTPFSFMSRMAIESIVAKQDEKSKYISDFSITLKEIRKVSVLTTKQNDPRYEVASAPDSDVFQNRAFEQNQELEQIGNMPGLPTPTSDRISIDNLGVEGLLEELKTQTGLDPEDFVIQ